MAINKSFEKASRMSQSRIFGSKLSLADKNITKQSQFDSRHQSISSPKMDELRMKYWKRSTEKTKKQFSSSIKTHKNNIVSQKTVNYKNQAQENQTQFIEKIPAYEFDQNFTSKTRYLIKPTSECKLKIDRKESEVSTGVRTASKSPASAPFSCISNNIKSEWAYDRQKVDLYKR